MNVLLKSRNYPLNLWHFINTLYVYSCSQERAQVQRARLLKYNRNNVMHKNWQILLLPQLVYTIYNSLFRKVYDSPENNILHYTPQQKHTPTNDLSCCVRIYITYNRTCFSKCLHQYIQIFIKQAIEIYNQVSQTSLFLLLSIHCIRCLRSHSRRLVYLLEYEEYLRCF